MLKSDLEFEISVVGSEIHKMEKELKNATDDSIKKSLEEKLEIAYKEYDILMAKYDNEDYENDYPELDHEHAAELDEYTRMSDAYHAYDGGCDI